MKFKNLEECNQGFITGNFHPQYDKIIIDSTEYIFNGKLIPSLLEMIDDNKKTVISFVNFQKDVITESLVFVWGKNQNNNICPLGIQLINHEEKIVEADIGSNPNIIGDTCPVKFLSLPGSPALNGKVDTGADICSLHADNWSIQGEKVHFKCPKLSPNMLSLPLQNHQAVRSASGVQYRPVIELNIKLNDKIMQNVLFNLADRGDMEFPVLIGRNVLEKGKFLIDPSLQEEVYWAKIKQLTENIVPPEFDLPSKIVSKDQIETILKLLTENKLTFSDIVSYIRTETIKTIEEIQY